MEVGAEIVGSTIRIDARDFTRLLSDLAKPTPVAIVDARDGNRDYSLVGVGLAWFANLADFDINFEDRHVTVSVHGPIIVPAALIRSPISETASVSRNLMRRQGTIVFDLSDYRVKRILGVTTGALDAIGGTSLSDEVEDLLMELTDHKVFIDIALFTVAEADDDLSHIEGTVSISPVVSTVGGPRRVSLGDTKRITIEIPAYIDSVKDCDRKFDPYRFVSAISLTVP